MLRIVINHTHGLARLCFFLSPIVMLGEVFCDLQQPTLMAQIIDNGLTQHNMNYVISHAWLMAGFAILGLACGASTGALGNYASLKMGQSLRTHMLRVALTSRNPRGLEPATLVTRITNDVTQMQNLVMMMTRGMVRSPMLLIGGIVMSIIVSPRLAPILLISMPFLLIFMFYVVRRSIPKYTRMQQAVDSVNRVMRENLQGAKTIKSYVLEDHQLNQFNGDNATLTARSQTAATATIILAPVIQLVLNLCVVIALGYGGTLVVSNTISDGQIIAFINYMIQITTAMVMTVNIITAFSRAITSGTRVGEVLAEETKVDTSSATNQQPQDSSISFDHVSFGYIDSKPILADITFDVPAGQWLGIIGATGSGKSSIINLLTRTYDAYTGTIKIGDVDIKDMALATVHQQVALAFQDAQLFSGTIRSNLTFGAPQATPADLTAATHTADADEFIDKLPAQLNAPVEQQGKNFSGGQRQRLNIARAITPNAPILVMDDATSAVDQETNARIKTRLDEARAGKTTLVISQRITNVMGCHEIIVLEDGKLVARGTHDELMQTSPFYKQLVQTQLGGGPNEHA